MNEIQIGKVATSQTTMAQKPKSKGASGFADILMGAVKQVDREEKAADSSIMDMLQGKTEIHETMIALQKADISMRLFLKVRNKMMDAYREIMHMQF
jgi:flagellar hook-basal body complex protein FliE